MRGSARARHSLNHYGLDWVPRLTAPIGYEHNMTLAQAKVNKIVVSSCFKIRGASGPVRDAPDTLTRYRTRPVPDTVATREPFTPKLPRW